MEEKEIKTEQEKTEQQPLSQEQAIIEENENLKQQVEEYKDKWMRNVAEFDNYKKRNANQWSEAFNEGVSNVLLKILPIGDNLDWALTLGLDEKTAEGIINLKRKFNDTLKTLDVEEIDPTGQPFDPNIAEAVMQVPAEEGETPDTVKQVFQKGYKRKDKMIRYATVSVIK